MIAGILNTKIAAPNTFVIVSGADTIWGTTLNMTNKTYSTIPNPVMYFLTIFDIFSPKESLSIITINRLTVNNNIKG